MNSSNFFCPWRALALPPLVPQPLTAPCPTDAPLPAASPTTGAAAPGPHQAICFPKASQRRGPAPPVPPLWLPMAALLKLLPFETSGSSSLLCIAPRLLGPLGPQPSSPWHGSTTACPPGSKGDRKGAEAQGMNPPKGCWVGSRAGPQHIPSGWGPASEGEGKR